jgi:hypothetical protein
MKLGHLLLRIALPLAGLALATCARAAEPEISDYQAEKAAERQLRSYNVESLRNICMLLGGAPDAEIADRSVTFKYDANSGRIFVFTRPNGREIYGIYGQQQAGREVEKCVSDLSYVFHVKYEPPPLAANANLPKVATPELPACQSHENQKYFNGKWYRATTINMFDREENAGGGSCLGYFSGTEASLPGVAFQILSENRVNTGRSTCAPFDCPVYSRHCTIAIYSDPAPAQVGLCIPTK